MCGDDRGCIVLLKMMKACLLAHYGECLDRAGVLLLPDGRTTYRVTDTIDVWGVYPTCDLPLYVQDCVVYVGWDLIDRRYLVSLSPEARGLDTMIRTLGLEKFDVQFAISCTEDEQEADLNPPALSNAA